MTDRRARMLGAIDIASSFGIEIGPLQWPLVHRHEGRVVYVDYADTETLRRTLRHPGVRPEDVKDVDIIWGTVPLAEAVGEPADYVLASHTIEHVPDLIGWLLEVRAALRIDGILGLAIPDRRLNFDAYRNDTGLAEVVEAHLRGYRRPSVRQVFEAAALKRQDASGDAWRADALTGTFPDEVLERAPGVFRWLKQNPGATDTYIDVHCWVFTPASFLALAGALSRLGCFPFSVDEITPSRADSGEFLVRLRAAAEGDTQAVERSIEQARRSVVPASPVDAGEAESARRIAELEQQVDALTKAMDVVRASTSWRVTAPVRTVAGLLRKERRHGRK